MARPAAGPVIYRAESIGTDDRDAWTRHFLQVAK
jgi:hypothetical protein